MNTSRIPDYPSNTLADMSVWFTEMANRGLLFHPEDRPTEIIDTTTGKAMFTPNECAKLDVIMAGMFQEFNDGVCDTAYPVFMKAAGYPPGS